MSTQFRISGLLLASAAALAFLAASPASATLIQTQGPVAFSGSDFITVTRNGGPGSASGSKSSTYATNSLPQFNTSNGVLTGAKVTVTGSRSQTANISASGGLKHAQDAHLSATGTNANFSAPGISYSFNNDFDISGNAGRCKEDGVPFLCPRTVGPIVKLTSGSASTNNLNAYAGNGNISVSVSGDLGATALIDPTAHTGGNAPYTTASVTNTINWSGTMSVEYDYLAHANPSFSAITDQDILNLDFGTVLQGSGPYSQNFALTNLWSTLIASDTVGLDLDSITGPNSPFSLTGGGIFSNLGAGLTSGLFGLSFDTTNIGDFTDQILLSLSDYDAGVGMANYLLTINLHGIVEQPEPPTPSVPEPATLALLATGLLAMGGINRRKHRTAR
jgi:hypothetical protein